MAGKGHAPRKLAEPGRLLLGLMLLAFVAGMTPRLLAARCCGDCDSAAEAATPDAEGPGFTNASRTPSTLPGRDRQRSSASPDPAAGIGKLLAPAPAATAGAGELLEDALPGIPGLPPAAAAVVESALAPTLLAGCVVAALKPPALAGHVVCEAIPGMGPCSEANRGKAPTDARNVSDLHALKALVCAWV